jgi:transcriptional regulator with XRE-family HTH domain
MEVSNMSENQLGENIAHYRKERGLSQEKVAEYMGVSRQAVTKWESNISKPSSDNLIKLAKLFEISVDVLLDNEEKETLPNRTEILTGKMPGFLLEYQLYV